MILSQEKVSPDAASVIAQYHVGVVKEVSDAVEKNDAVIVGMAGNPHVKQAKKAFEKAGMTYKYLEYGSYLSGWKTRLAIKLWSGWATYPQVFVKGKLVGGASDLEKFLKIKA